MAVLQMRKIRIYGLKRNRKQILEMLQRSSAVEVQELPMQEEDVFQQADVSSSRALFEKGLRDSQEALEILSQYVPAKGSMLGFLNGRKPISTEEYYAFADRWEDVRRTTQEILSLEREIREKDGEIRRLETRLEALQPWLKLDVSMRFAGTKSTSAFTGTLPGSRTALEVETKLEEASPGLKASVEVVSAGQEQTCVFVLCPKAQAEAAETALRALGFSRPSSPSKTAPAEKAKELTEQVQVLKREKEEREEKIRSLAVRREDLQYAADYLTMRLEKYEVIGKLEQSRHVFILSGYMPERDTAALSEKLEALEAAMETEIPSEDEDVPVLLQNNRFAEPVEGVLESFSMPGKGEIDPSPVMAVFYYILFGMMLSDAAYGLIMVAACGFCLWKFKNMELSMRKALRMFFFCGISTTFWGFLYGSFFGDVVGAFSGTFLGERRDLGPLWFSPLDEPMRMLMFSLLVGVIHIFVALFLGAVQFWKQKRYKDLIYDIVFWYLLVGGLILLLLSTDMFADIAGIEKLGEPAGTIGSIAAGIGAVGILLTGGRESKNPVKRLLKGAYSLYNVTGYLGDILSYSRLLALGLATGVIAQVINSMGTMMGSGPVGLIAFILIFLVGHTINIAINLLGAYVHTNRLQFVEFFGKFFEGGGRKFQPFGVHTKYFKIREDK